MMADDAENTPRTCEISDEVDLWFAPLRVVRVLALALFLSRFQVRQQSLRVHDLV